MVRPHESKRRKSCVNQHSSSAASPRRKPASQANSTPSPSRPAHLRAHTTGQAEGQPPGLRPSSPADRKSASPGNAETTGALHLGELRGTQLRSRLLHPHQEREPRRATRSPTSVRCRRRTASNPPTGRPQCRPFLHRSSVRKIMTTPSHFSDLAARRKVDMIAYAKPGPSRAFPSIREIPSTRIAGAARPRHRSPRQQSTSRCSKP